MKKLSTEGERYFFLKDRCIGIGIGIFRHIIWINNTNTVT
jgi:hypothetical protein